MVFVTGATGLVGGYLLLELSKRNQSIIALKRKSSNLKPVQKLFEEFASAEAFNRIRWVEGDLLDVPFLSDVLQGVTTIYHAAAYVSFDNREKKKIHQINVEGTETLVNVAIELKIPHFAFVSSVATLDLPELATVIDENSGWNPEENHSEYAISKKKAEMAVWKASQENMKVIVVNPAIIIGSFDAKRESENIFKFSAKSTAYATSGKTGYVDVRDVSYLLAELVEKNIWNDNFVLSSENKTYFEIIQTIRKQWNLSDPKLISKSQLTWIYYLSQISKFLGGKYLSKASLDALTSQVNYDNNKIKSTLNFQFISVDESLKFHGNRWKSLNSK